MKERSITNQKLATLLVRLLRQRGPPAPPRSLRGWRPPCQGWGLSRRDRAKALPALHARMELHLLNHAAFTRFCSRSGTDSAFAFARLRRKWAVSSDHRPPVSAAKTTKRARPCGLFPAPRFLQSHAGAPGGSPPRTPIPPERKHQRGVYCQLGSLPQVNPSAITSILRPSRPLKTPTSRSRTKALGVTLAPASHTWAAAHSRGNPRFPKTPASEHAAR